MNKFNNSLMGYDKAEVNAFINEVTDQFERMLNKLKQKDADIEALKKELTKYENLESTLNKTIRAQIYAGEETLPYGNYYINLKVDYNDVCYVLISENDMILSIK